MRFVVAEDEALLRQGLVHVLEHAGHEVVGIATDGQELIRQVEACQPDVAITDIRMPPTHTTEGLDAALQINQSWPGVGLVVLSQHVLRQHALQLLSERPSGIGYLLKQRIADVPTFLSDVERIARGATVLDPEVVSLMVARARRRDSAVDRLTPRQREVLDLMAQGRSNAGIGQQLHITEKAVVSHISNIYAQLGIHEDASDHRRVLAVAQYLSRDPSEDD